MDDIDKIIGQWKRERPDLDVSAMALIGRIGRLREYLLQEQEKVFARHGLNYSGFDVLATLRRQGTPYALSPGDLMASMMITSGTMTNRIDQLVKAGLVTRTANPNDRRSMIVSLTVKGLAVIEEAVGEHVANQKRLVAPLSEAEQALLNGLVTKYLAAIGST
jgi:DNA-binding MarR family transcriptional regulator